MSITVTCDECTKTHRVRTTAIGKQFACKGCGKSLTVEASAQIDDHRDRQPSSQGVAFEMTSHGWRLIASTRSIFASVAMFAISVIALVGLESSIQLLRAAWDNPGGWLMLVFCLPLSILSAYQTVFSLCGKIVITVEGHQGDVFTGVGVVGRRQPFDWSRTTSVDDECVRTRSGVSYRLVLDGRTQIRFGGSLPKDRQLDVLHRLRNLLRQEHLRQHPGSPQQDSSKLAEARPQESHRTRLGDGAPEISPDALVCQDGGTTDKPVSVIVDRAAGMIHFQNCHSPQGFWTMSLSPLPWFSCPLSDLIAARPGDQRCKSLIIVTAAGEASMASTATNYERLCQVLPDLVPQNAGNLCADHPVVMQMSMLWSLFTILVGLMTGWFLTALNASNSSLFLHLLAGAVVGAALPFLVALLMSRMRGQ